MLSLVQETSLQRPKIRAKSEFPDSFMNPPYMSIHRAGIHDIEIVYPRRSTAEYETGDGVPQLSWRIPPAKSIPGIVSVAQKLVADPPYLPTQTQPPEITTLLAPRINYL
jgi:hypothetical protein